MLPRARLAAERNASSSPSVTEPLSPSLMQRPDSGLDNRWQSGYRSPVKDYSTCKVRWKCKWDFYVAVLSFIIDSNGWSQLVLSCIEHGGAAYLVARLVCIALIGVPLLLFEIGIGHQSCMGPLKFFSHRNLRPVFNGVGLFLMVGSVYKAVGDSAVTMWPVSNTLFLLLGDTIEGLNRSAPEMEHPASSLMTFSELDALTVMALSIVWIVVVLIVIWGIRFISKVAYVTLLGPLLLLPIILGAALYIDQANVYQGLVFILNPSWEKLLEIPMWIEAMKDTIFSFGLGYGILTFLTALSTAKVKCFRTSVVLMLVNTVTLCVMLAISGVMTTSSLPANVARMAANRSEVVFEAISKGLAADGGHAWSITFYATLFLLNVDTLIFIASMLANAFSSTRWRPVFSVLFGAGLYVLSLPLATRGRLLVMDVMDHYTGQLMPICGAFLMVAATGASLQSCSVVDLFEIVAPFKFAFPGQSYLYVGYKAALPIALAMCVVGSAVRLVSGGASSPVSADPQLVVLGISLAAVPWVFIVLSPFYLLACRDRHQPVVKRWRELWHKSDYEHWLYRRPQLPGDERFDETAFSDGGRGGADSSCIYELPERFSTNRAVSYYTSATLLAGEVPVVYSTYHC